MSILLQKTWQNKDTTKATKINCCFLDANKPLLQQKHNNKTTTKDTTTRQFILARQSALTVMTSQTRAAICICAAC